MGRRWWRSGYCTKKAAERGNSLSLVPFLLFKLSEFPRISLPKLSEKGSERVFEGGFGRYEDAEMGPKSLRGGL